MEVGRCRPSPELFPEAEDHFVDSLAFLLGKNGLHLRDGVTKPGMSKRFALKSTTSMEYVLHMYLKSFNLSKLAHKMYEKVRFKAL